MPRHSVVVVGGGNAGMSATVAAQEQGGNVLLLERAPCPERGGNTAFTGGGTRFAYHVDGQRFIDEGADFRDYTYAKYGREILAQPQQWAWQVFDGKVLGLLRDEYSIREVSKVRANSLGELARRMEDVDQAAFLTPFEASGTVGRSLRAR